MPAPQAPTPQPVDCTKKSVPEFAKYTPSTPDPPFPVSLELAKTGLPVVSFASMVYVLVPVMVDI